MWIAPNKDHYSLQTADRFDGIEVFQTGSLIIHKVELNDTGNYTCVASTNQSSVQAVMSLTVKPSSHSSGKPPNRAMDKPEVKSLS